MVDAINSLLYKLFAHVHLCYFCMCIHTKINSTVSNDIKVDHIIYDRV